MALEQRIMSERMRIGQALVERGTITEEQLRAALESQRSNPDTPLGHVLDEDFGVPIEEVDQAHMQVVLLPRFRKIIMTRLLALTKGDKFAKGLDMVNFVTSIVTVAKEFEVRVYNCRRYTHAQGGHVRGDDDQGFTTLMAVHVEVKTRKGSSVEGMLHASYDTHSDDLVITDDEARIKEIFYYGLRTAFRSA